MAASATQDEVALRTENVSKSYGSRPALLELDLEVGSAEFVALLGPNGAGKSTLFQLLTGLFAPDAGRIVITGHDVRDDFPSALAQLGVVFQQPTLDLDLTVEANLRFHARLHGKGRSARSRIAEELERLELTGERHTRCRELSGGNRRKVELARALLHNPRLLLMDEATVGLDPRSRRNLLAYVRGLCSERGVSVLWATHLVDEAEDADRVMMLHEGRVLAEGAPRALAADVGTASLEDAFLQMTSGGEPTAADGALAS